MKVKSEREVTQSCPTFSDPMDCSLPGSSVHGIFQAAVLEWGAIAFSCPSWVALNGLAHSFIELDKSVVHVISLNSLNVNVKLNVTVKV